MKKSLLLLFIIPLLSFTVVHKFYLALTEIEFNKKKQSVQMIMNVFIDDIELGLNNEFKIDAQIFNKNEIENLDDYFHKYLQKHFKISINNQEQEFKFIGKESDGNLIFFYLEINNVTDIKTIEVKNTVLVKEFKEQRNLVKAKVNGEKGSLFLTKKNDKGLLKF